MDNETCLPNWKKLFIKSCGWVVLFSPYLQQTISLLSPYHMRIHFQGHVLGVECSLSPLGGQLAGDWEQGRSVHLWGPQKNGELALSSPASALPFAALSLCCPQVASCAM